MGLNGAAAQEGEGAFSPPSEGGQGVRTRLCLYKVVYRAAGGAGGSAGSGKGAAGGHKQPSVLASLVKPAPAAAAAPAPAAPPASSSSSSSSSSSASPPPPPSAGAPPPQPPARIVSTHFLGVVSASTKLGLVSEFLQALQPRGAPSLVSPSAASAPGAPRLRLDAAPAAPPACIEWTQTVVVLEPLPAWEPAFPTHKGTAGAAAGCISGALAAAGVALRFASSAAAAAAMPRHRYRTLLVAPVVEQQQQQQQPPRQQQQRQQQQQGAGGGGGGGGGAGASRATTFAAAAAPPPAAAAAAAPAAPPAPFALGRAIAVPVLPCTTLEEVLAYASGRLGAPQAALQLGSSSLLAMAGGERGGDALGSLPDIAGLLWADGEEGAGGGGGGGGGGGDDFIELEETEGEEEEVEVVKDEWAFVAEDAASSTRAAKGAATTLARLTGAHAPAAAQQDMLYKTGCRQPQLLGQVDSAGALTFLHGVYETQVRSALTEAPLASGQHPSLALLVLPLQLSPAVGAAAGGAGAGAGEGAPPSPWSPLRDITGLRMLVRCAEWAPEEALLPTAGGIPAVLELLEKERRAALAAAAEAAAAATLDVDDADTAASTTKRAKKAEKGVRL